MRTPRERRSVTLRLALLASVCLVGCSADDAASPGLRSSGTPNASTAGDASSASPEGGSTDHPDPGDAAGGTLPTPTASDSGPDAGAGGVTSDGGAAARGCLPGDLFCDDFDSYALGAAVSSKWTTDTANGTLAIDSTRARSGKALKVHTDGNGRALIKIAGLAPPNNSYFGRINAWFTAFPSAPNYAHYTVVEAAGAGNSTLVRPLGGQFIAEAGNKKMWGVGSFGGPTGDWTRWKETAPSEAQKWLCLEWEMSAPDNTVRVWIDGVAKPELTVSTKNHDGTSADFVFPKVSTVTVGWWLYQGGPTPAQYDIWIDDVALRTSRVGCL